MIKNIIFDFGNVLVEWNEDKIVANYSDNKEEQEILKKVIFKSKEWLKLDDGSMSCQEAIPLFKEKLPENLKNSVEEVMQWYTKMSINKEIYYRLFEKFELIPQECFFIDDIEKNIQVAKKCGMEGYIFDMNNFGKLSDELKRRRIL